MQDAVVKSASQTIADTIAARLTDAIAKRGKASLVVSGGSSPFDVFAKLAEKDLPWADVQITLVDDRCVSENDPNSNIRLVLEHLLINQASAAKFVALQDLDADAMMPFDVVVMGMGLDGHFASLFPDMLNDPDAFGETAPPQILYTDAKGDPALPRITMNLSMLLACHYLVLLVKGKEKQALVTQIKADPVAALAQFPVASLLAQSKTAVQICYLD